MGYITNYKPLKINQILNNKQYYIYKHLRDSLCENKYVYEARSYDDKIEVIREIEVSDILELLYNDDNTNRATMYIAHHPDTPLHILEELSTHCDSLVRRKVAENPNIPDSLRAKMIKDDDVYVLTGIARHTKDPNILNYLSYNKRLGRIVAYNKYTTPSILKKLYIANHPVVWDGLASNKNTPKEVLLRLSFCNSWHVIQELIKNPSTPSLVIQKLMYNQDEEVRVKAGYHPCNSNGVLYIHTYNPIWGFIQRNWISLKIWKELISPVTNKDIDKYQQEAEEELEYFLRSNERTSNDKFLQC